MTLSNDFMIFLKKERAGLEPAQRNLYHLSYLSIMPHCAAVTINGWGDTRDSYVGQLPTSPLYTG